MAWFPVFTELNDRSVLIVGAGAVARRKLSTLQRYGARVTLIASEIPDDLKAEPGLLWEERVYRPGDERDMALVLAATDAPEVNREVALRCREAGIPVNVADDRSLCSFLFPSTILREPLSIGICTGGSSPTAAAWLRQTIEAELPEDMETLLTWLDDQRAVCAARIPEQRKRSELLRALFAECMRLRRPLTEEETRVLYRPCTEEEIS